MKEEGRALREEGRMLYEIGVEVSALVGKDQPRLLISESKRFFLCSSVQIMRESAREVLLSDPTTIGRTM